MAIKGFINVQELTLIKIQTPNLIVKENKLPLRNISKELTT